jgi:hypothetical protein
MRVRMLCAAACWLTAVPVFAQSKEVTGPYTLTAPIVMCTDVPTTATPVPRITIFGPYTTDGRTIATQGWMIVKRVSDDRLAIGQRYVTQRANGAGLKTTFGKSYSDYGSLRVTGWVTIRAMDDVNALAEVGFACDSIESGDFLEPYVEMTFPADATAMLYPDFDDRAHVLFGADNREAVGMGQITSIDRGTRHGTVPGERFAIYRDQHNGQPLNYVGDVVVLTTSEATSKVMVTRSVEQIVNGDTAVRRRLP